MKKNKQGFTLVELLVVIAILGILMAVFVPKIADALSSANVTAMVNKGKQIVEAISQKSIKDSSNPVWPMYENPATQDPNKNDVYNKSFGTSTEYFNALFDVQNQGKKAAISFDLLANLWGEGVAEASSGNLTKDNVAWHILSGANNFTSSDAIPVLISRNVDVGQFPISGQENDMTKRTEKLTLGSKYPQPFGEKACVVVLKSGAAFGLEDDKCTYKDVYEKIRIVRVPEGVKLKYLEP